MLDWFLARFVESRSMTVSTRPAFLLVSTTFIVHACFSSLKRKPAQFFSAQPVEIGKNESSAFTKLSIHRAMQVELDVHVRCSLVIRYSFQHKYYNHVENNPVVVQIQNYAN